MNKIIKTMGLMTAISGCMLANSMVSGCYKESAPQTELTEKNKNFNPITENSKLWGTLTALSIIGLAGFYGKKRYCDYNIPYKRVHSFLDNFCSMSPANIIKNTENLKTRFMNFFKKHHNGDLSSSYQFIYTLEALKDAVEHGEIPEKELNIKLKYLFDKAVTKKSKFKKTDKKYRYIYPDINFDKHYGRIIITKGTEYKNTREPFVYDKMKKDDVIPELKSMEKIIKNDHYIPYCKHDYEDLTEKIDIAYDFLRIDKPLPSNLLDEINQLFKTKQLRKNIQL